MKQYRDINGNPFRIPTNWRKSTDEYLHDRGVFLYNPPIYDPTIQKRGGFILTDTGCTHVVVDKTIDLIQADLNTKIATDIEQLWIAADQKIHGQISGGALTKVLLMAKSGDPNAILAVAWYEAEWAEYYRRRDAITNGEVLNTDFTTRPLMPVSTRILMGL